MSERAGLLDLRKLGVLPQKRSAPCLHCGSMNPHPVDYLWRNKEDRVLFGCCVQALTESYGADPTRVIKQDSASFLAD